MGVSWRGGPEVTPSLAPGCAEVTPSLAPGWAAACVSPSCCFWELSPSLVRDRTHSVLG